MTNSCMETFKFSTSGFRGKIGKELNPETALKIGQAIGSYLPNRSQIFCGRDNRRTSSALLLALISGLTSFRGHRVRFSMEPVPTAAGVMYAGRHRISNTVIVTGSHLPREDNGIIFFENTNSYFSGALGVPESHCSDWAEYTDPELITDLSVCYRRWLWEIRDRLFSRMEPIVDSILVDTANGPAGLFLPDLLEPLCNRIVQYNCELDDSFPNRPSEPNPKNLVQTAARVVESRCDLGLATDMDADRVVFILRNGAILNGDVLGILLAEQIWKRMNGAPVVATLNSTLLLGQFADNLGGRVNYTPVGPPALVREMKQAGAEFGFEGNGKYIFRRYSMVPDAAISALVVLQMINDSQQPLEALTRAIPLTVYRSEKTPFQRCESDRFIDFLKTEQDRFLDEKPANLDDSDGLKLVYDDRSWLMIRPSGTENVIRVIAESLCAERVDELVARGFELINIYRRTYLTTETV